MNELASADPAAVWQEDDGLDDVERDRLHDALQASDDDIASGRVRPADDVLAELFGTE